MSDTPTHETPEHVIGELFAVAKLKEDGYRAEITPSDIRSWAERFKEALFRDRDEIVDATLAKRGPLLNCEVYRTDAKALRAYRRLAPMGPTYNEWLFRPSNPSRRPFARVCDLPAGEIFAALKQRRNIDATFTTRLIVNCLLSPASDDPGDVAQRNVDDVKFFIRSAVSLIRAHYDHHERSFHEVADRIAKRLEEIGMGDLASFVRAQTGDEPSWVPMDAAPTSSAPTPAPPTLGSLLAEARRLLERAQNTTRDTGVIADISESLECLSGAEDYAKATEGQPASESTASPAPSGEDPAGAPPWPRCEREADEVEKRAGFARFCSTCGTACRYAGEEHLVICKHHQFAIK